MNGYIAPEDQVFGVSFLDRLDADIEANTFQGSVKLDSVLMSIKHNLVNILNTRVGSAQSAPSLGLVDFNDANLDTLDLSLHIKLSIEECIRDYEPRLSSTIVTSHYDDRMPVLLRFTIESTLNSESLHESVRFQLMLDSNHQYRVL